MPYASTMKAWANVLNEHQYGYGTDRFAKALIEANRDVAVEYKAINSVKRNGTYRIVSFNVLCLPQFLSRALYLKRQEAGPW